jgi:hypothetical protein
MNGEEAREELREWLSLPLTHSVHYACETFYYKEPPTRIAAIGVKNYRTNESHVFSVHDEIMRLGLSDSAVEPNGSEYAEVEKSMLGHFYDYVGSQGLNAARWLHWSMNSDQFGFAHLSNRFRDLGGKPLDIPASNRLCVSNSLHSIYGARFMCDPKLPNVAKMNQLTGPNFLPGDKEAFAFVAGKWREIHNASKEKASLILEIASLAVRKELLTHESLSVADMSDVAKVVALCQRFHKVANHVKCDYRKDRHGFQIEDEYAVQHLMHGLLLTLVDDIRPEEHTPSLGAGSSRVDFFLKKENLVVETKMIRDSLLDKQLTDELLIDIGRYSGMKVKDLVCLVYDPLALLKNPAGIKADLESKSSANLTVHLVIVPPV